MGRQRNTLCGPLMPVVWVSFFLTPNCGLQHGSPGYALPKLLTCGTKRPCILATESRGNKKKRTLTFYYIRNDPHCRQPSERSARIRLQLRTLPMFDCHLGRGCNLRCGTFSTFMWHLGRPCQISRRDMPTTTRGSQTHIHIPNENDPPPTRVAIKPQMLPEALARENNSPRKAPAKYLPAKPRRPPKANLV